MTILCLPVSFWSDLLYVDPYLGAILETLRSETCAQNLLALEQMAGQDVYQCLELMGHLHESWLPGCRHGLRLPPEEDCLLGINMQLSQQGRGKAEEPLSARYSVSP